MSEVYMDDIRPCPFCGGTAWTDLHWREVVFSEKKSSERPYAWYVQCTRCYMKTQYCDTLDLAIKVWNRRVGDNDEEEAIAERKTDETD